MAEQRMDWQSGRPAFLQVDVPGVGPISLATLDQLREAGRADRSGVDHLAWWVAELAAQAEDRLADAGALLVPRRAWWQVPAGLSPLLAEADRLVSRISRLDRAIAGLDAGPGAARPDPVSRLRTWTRGRLVRRQRVRAAARLRQKLVAVARGSAADGVDVPGVEPLLEQAVELERRAGGLQAALAAASTRLGALKRELGLREEAARHLGFDSLHLAACFRAYGMPAIDSPIALEADEAAFLAVPAELARARPGIHGTEDDQGQAVPVAHTGVQLWIGALRHRGMPLQALDRVDGGVLVVTNRRLAFLGRAEGVAIPLAGVVDLAVYTDGIAVSRLGREHPDFFLVAAPAQVTFYLNWALQGSQALR